MKAYQPLRWTLNDAAKEFSIDPKTLTKRLTELSLACGKDGKFSTSQIISARFGDMEGEKLRKITAEATKAEVEAAKAMGEVMLSADADRELADFGAGVRSIIEADKSLTEAQKAALFTKLEALKLDKPEK